MGLEKTRKPAKQSKPEFAVARYTKAHAPEATPPAPLRLVGKSTERHVKKFAELSETVRRVGSTFGIKKSEIMRAVEEGQIDHAVQQFQRQAYSTIVNLIPIAEKAYLKDRREHQAYALNALISQGRELANDLMAADNKNQLCETLIAEILTPAFKQILQQLMQEQMMLKTALSDKLKPEFLALSSAEFDRSLRTVAGSMTEIFKGTSEQIRKKLLGE